MAIYTVESADTTSGKSFISKVNTVLALDFDDTAKRVAFDCEGINLSRLGTVEIVSICFPTLDVYLVDFGGVCPQILKSVTNLFESASVTKVIHDCRMDCDALYHLHGIQVNNVHDTSCFHIVEDGNLNDVLSYNGISVNKARDKSVYERNPRFWSTRPLTTTMVEWASSDVKSLFALADAQLSHISSASKSAAIAKSTQYSRNVCGMKVSTGLSVRNPGRFIGPRGQSIRSLSKRTGTLIYAREGRWFVFYDNDASLDAVKRSMSM
jgi:ribonuclease D